MSRSAYSGPDVRDPKQRPAAFAGLTKRLEEREIKFLPVKSVRWYPDAEKRSPMDPETHRRIYGEWKGTK